MPPKRKLPASKTGNDTEKRTRVSKKAAGDSANGKKTSQDAFAKACEAWFDRYKETADEITPEGCQTFFSDIDVSLESIKPFLIGWKMNASRMGYFKKEEWMRGLRELKADTPEKLKKELVALERAIQDQDQFKKLYLFSFGFAKTAGQKSMDVDIAIALWQLMLSNRKNHHHIDSFVEFLQEEKPVKVINKDQWASLLDFSLMIPEDLKDYDSTSSWPVLFDEYVAWKKGSST